MRILVTGFEPFNGREINPSEEVVKELKAPEGVELQKEILPVEFRKAAAILKQRIKEFKPDYILSVGQAGNRPEIGVERVALNLDCVRSSDGSSLLPDNGGDQPVDVKIEEDGENAYFATLPVWEIVEAIQKEDVKAAVSYTAGTYVCNHIMYTALYEVSRMGLNTKAGFIHVPFLPSQLTEGEGKGFSMEQEDMVRGIQTAIRLLAEM